MKKPLRYMLSVMLMLALMLSMGTAAFADKTDSELPVEYVTYGVGLPDAPGVDRHELGDDDITVTANFVNKVFKAKIKLVGADGTTVITDPNLVQIKGTDGKYKAVKHDSEVEVVFDNNVNIGLTSTGNGYKITKYTITDASTSKVKTATESNCSDFNFKVTKEGVSEIEIRLEVK